MLHSVVPRRMSILWEMSVGLEETRTLHEHWSPELWQTKENANGTNCRSQKISWVLRIIWNAWYFSPRFNAKMCVTTCVVRNVHYTGLIVHFTTQMFKMEETLINRVESSESVRGCWVNDTLIILITANKCPKARIGACCTAADKHMWREFSAIAPIHHRGTEFLSRHALPRWWSAAYRWRHVTRESHHAIDRQAFTINYAGYALCTWIPFTKQYPRTDSSRNSRSLWKRE